MKKCLIASLVLLSATAAIAQKTYTLDKYHSRVGFSVHHFGISHVEGNFKTFDATLEANKPDLSDAVISFTADVNSINTDVEYRDNDLKSPAYFDAVKFPTLSFKSTSFKKIAGKNYKLAGTMTMHGITKPVLFNATFNGTAVTAMKKPTAGFTITGKIKRSDFGVGGSPFTSGIGDEVELRSNVEFTIGN